MEKQYYYIQDGEQKGPVSLEELKKIVDQDTFVWSAGMKDWQPVKEIPDLAELIAPPIQQENTPSPSTPTKEEQQIPNSTTSYSEYCPPTYLAWSIVVTILCCWPLGIPAIVYASKVESTFHRGNKELAHHYSRKARKWMIASIVGAFVFLFLYILIIAFGLITGVQNGDISSDWI